MLITVFTQFLAATIGWYSHSKLAFTGHHAVAPQATVQVPLDAYKMDFVFADVEAGEGTYDNHGGFDYHLPVEGSGLTEPPLHVVHVSLEMAPICKAGLRARALRPVPASAGAGTGHSTGFVVCVYGVWLQRISAH